MADDLPQNVREMLDHTYDVISGDSALSQIYERYVYRSRNEPCQLLQEATDRITGLETGQYTYEDFETSANRIRLSNTENGETSYLDATHLSAFMQQYGPDATLRSLQSFLSPEKVQLMMFVAGSLNAELPEAMQSHPVSRFVPLKPDIRTCLMM